MDDAFRLARAQNGTVRDALQERDMTAPAELARRLRDLADRYCAIDADAMIDARIAACALERMAWRPIETAPKALPVPSPGGMLVRAIYILGYCPDESAVDPSSCICVVWWEPQLDGGCWQGEGDMRMRPTHWMPLPPSPEAT
jgi:hypothetical protein